MGLSRREISEIADVLNEKINIPIVGEKFEKYFLTGAIVHVDEILEGELGLDFNDLVSDPSSGLSQEEKQELLSKITEFINEKVNIPVISEMQEQFLIELVLNAIVDFAVKKIKGEDTKEVA